MDRELLLKYGVDVDKGLRNCIGNAEFYKQILAMFKDDNCLERAEYALTNRDNKALFACLHELKGMSGNAALVDLYNKTVPLVELLRHGTDDEQAVDKMFSEVVSAYNLACRGIDLIIKQP